MVTYVALLRAINVGGTGKLKMAELVSLCGEAGFANARTYIQSGNVVFTSRAGEATVKTTFERALTTRLGKPAAVMIRSAAELAAVHSANPFPAAHPSRVIVMFYDTPLSKAAVAAAQPPGGEQLVLHGRELFILYPDGQGTSKLRVPMATSATGRNLNTVGRLVDLAAT